MVMVTVPRLGLRATRRSLGRRTPNQNSAGLPVQGTASPAPKLARRSRSRPYHVRAAARADCGRPGPTTAWQKAQVLARCQAGGRRGGGRDRLPAAGRVSAVIGAAGQPGLGPSLLFIDISKSTAQSVYDTAGPAPTGPGQRPAIERPPTMGKRDSGRDAETLNQSSADGRRGSTVPFAISQRSG